MVTLVLFSGCNKSREPRDVVINSDTMIIYQVIERDDLKLGKYEYWVRDNSVKGWKLISDKKFKIGDTLFIGTQWK
jgi:hypothetical protein